MLDTHVFLWYLMDDPQLDAVFRARINDLRNRIFISPATYWEIAIKVALGKLLLTIEYDELLEKAFSELGFEFLPILPRHTSRLLNLPFHHRDPFDRLLIAQAIEENLPILRRDSAFDHYDVRRI